MSYKGRMRFGNLTRNERYRRILLGEQTNDDGGSSGPADVTIESMSYGTGSISSVTAINVTKPTGTVEGDVLLVFQYCANDGAAHHANNATYPFTLATQQWTTVGSDWSFFVSYRVAGASEPASYAFTNSASTQYGDIILMRVTGLDNTDPYDASSSADAAGAAGLTVTEADVTTTTDNAWMLHQLCAWTGDTASSALTDGGGRTSTDVDLSSISLTFPGVWDGFKWSNAGAAGVQAGGTWNWSSGVTTQHKGIITAWNRA